LKLKNFLSQREIIPVIILAFLARLVLSVRQYAMTWDSSVYLGMAKSIFSFGHLGLWEPIRPLAWPFVLGIFWKIGLNPVTMGIVLQIALQVASVYLVYKITHRIFHKDLAILASLLFMFSPVLLESAFSLHSASLAMFFCLLSVYLFLNEKFFASGIIASLAFLATFYYGLFLVIFLIFLLRFKRFEPYKLLLGGFCIPLVPYLLLNLVLYRDPLLPFFSASSVIKNVVACNFLHAVPWYQYFVWIFLDNPLNLLLPVGLFFLFKKAETNRLLVFAGFALPFVYLATLHCRDVRYILFFLPFLSIITALGIESIMQKIRKKNYRGFFLVLIILLAAAYPLYRMLTLNAPADNADYYKLTNATNATLLTNNPKLALYTDSRLELLYYPLYTSSKAEFYAGDVVKNRRDLVFIDTCYGDLLCSPNDLKCPGATGNLMNALASNYKKVYYANYTMCEYSVFSGAK